MGFETVVGKAVAYLDLDTSGFQAGIQTAIGQMSVLTDSESTFGQKLSTVGTGMQTVGRSLTRNVTTPIALGMGFATKRTMDFEEAMSNVAALSGASANEIELMHDKALELGSATKFTSKEVADAFSYMALAGWDTTQMLDGISGVLDLAASSDMDLANASDIVTDYLSAFGLEAKDAASMVDMLAYAQANSNTTTQQLADAFGNSASFMHTAGQEVNTVTALLSAMANQGLKGSEAGTALSATMRDIVQKMDDGKIAIGDTNVAVMDSEGNFRDLVDILADVEKATEGMGDAEKTSALMMTFTSRSIKGLGTILTEGTDSIKGFRDELDKSGGTASEISEIMLDNLAGSITKLTSAIDVFMVKVGERLAPYIRKFADWLTDITNKLDQLSDDEFDQIVKIGLIVAAAGPLLSIVGKFLTGISSIITFAGQIGPLFSGVFGLLTKGFSGVSGLISGIGTVGSTVFGGIKTLISGIGTVATTVFQGMLTLVQTVFGAIGTAIKTAIGFVTQFASAIGGIVAIIAGVVIAAKAFFDMWNEGFTWAKELVMLLGIALVAVGAIILGAPAVIAGVIAAIVAVVATAVILIHQHWDEIKEGFHKMVEAIKEWWNNLWESAAEKVEELKQKVHEKIEALKEGVREKVEAIKEHWEQTWEKFQDKVEEIKEKVKEKVEELKEKAVEKIVEMKDKFIERFEELKEKAIDKFNEMKDRAIEKFQEMREKAEQKVQEMKEKVWERIQDIKEKFVDKIEDMKKDAVEKFEKLKEEVKTKVENMKTALVEKFEELKNQGKEKLQALHDAVSQIGDKIKEKFDKLKESIGQAIKKFKDIGKDLINNILDGVKSAWEALKNWVEDKFGWIGEKVGSIVDKAKDLLNIGSSASSNSSVSSSKVSATSGRTTTSTRTGTSTSSRSTNNYGDTYNFYGKVNDPYENARDVKNAKRAAAYT